MSLLRPTGGDWIAGTMHYTVLMEVYDPTRLSQDMWFGSDGISYSVNLTWLQSLVRKIELALTK